MKKTVPFEVFEKNQTIYFNILRLAELEDRLGVSINEIVKSEAGVKFCLAGLTVGMKHHYHKPTPDFFADKIEEHLDNGGDLSDIAIPIVKAIFATGIFGKEINEGIEKRAAELEKDEKNEQRTK